jgi:putative PIN family toxin of toxin-antitoxin system
MKPIRVVLDTNVIVSGLRSQNGFAYKLLRQIGTESLHICLSVPLVLEYEKTLSSPQVKVPFSASDIGRFLNYLCATGSHHKAHFLWRPFLRDANDDMVLELAVAAGCRYIVTFNMKDFVGTEQFGIEAIRPKELLKKIGAKT